MLSREVGGWLVCVDNDDAVVVRDFFLYLKRKLKILALSW